ncbi:unnamed protein product [Durusdinium trenchii]|uniref:Uncharacterized protein n=1 Tax=Durusdinium trenchii TaxID=1381693 RepID=A0ABP0IM02_9DINO
MWPSTVPGAPLGVVPREPTRLPPLTGDGDEEAKRGTRPRRGANDMASLSRKRRDLALANREHAMLTLPGTLLKSPKLRQSPALMEPERLAAPGDGAEEPPPDVSEGQKEIQRLQEELRLRSAEAEQYRASFKKKSEEYEGCKVLLDVAQAELHLCQERLHKQSPAPPMLKQRRLKGVGIYASEREVAEEVAAWSVSLTLTRVMRAIQAQRGEEEELKTAEGLAIKVKRQQELLRASEVKIRRLEERCQRQQENFRSQLAAAQAENDEEVEAANAQLKELEQERVRAEKHFRSRLAAADSENDAEVQAANAKMMELERERIRAEAKIKSVKEKDLRQQENFRSQLAAAHAENDEEVEAANAKMAALEQERIKAEARILSLKAKEHQQQEKFRAQLAAAQSENEEELQAANAKMEELERERVKAEESFRLRLAGAQSENDEEVQAANAKMAELEQARTRAEARIKSLKAKEQQQQESFKAQLAAAQSENDEELQAANVRMEELERERRKAEESFRLQLADARSENDEEVQAANAKMAELEQARTRAEARIKSLKAKEQQQQESFRVQLAAAQSENDEELQAANAKMEELEQERIKAEESLRLQLAEARSENDEEVQAANAKMAELLQERRSAEARIKSLKAKEQQQQESFKAQLAAAQSENDEELQAANAKMEELERERIKAEESFRLRLADARSENDEEVQAANAKMAELLQERSRAEARIRSLKAKEQQQQENFRAQLASAQSENDDELQAANAKMEELERERIKAEESFKSRLAHAQNKNREEVQAANAKMAELEEERSRAEAKIRSLKARDQQQQEQFRAQLAAAQSENDKELQAATAKMEELERERIKAEESRRSEHDDVTQLAELEQERQRAEARIRSLKAREQEQQEKFRAQLAAAQSENDEELQAAHAKIAELERDRLQAEEAIRLRVAKAEEMEAANAKIAELEQERSRAKEKVKLLKAKELEQQDKFRAQLAAAQSENDEELQAENAKLAELEQEWRVEELTRPRPSIGLKGQLPTIQEHQVHQEPFVSSSGQMQRDAAMAGGALSEAARRETWNDSDRASGTEWDVPEDRWREEAASEFIREEGLQEDEDLDEEARRIAQKVQPLRRGDAASRSPPPDTGGTPTPVEDARRGEVEPSTTRWTQTSPTAEGSEAKPEKALVTAQEEVRVMKLVVANSKKEIAYYNKVLMEKNAEHQQELQELHESLEHERRRCTEDMKHWKAHVKKELGKDPILAVALTMWEREVTSLRTSHAFKEWKRKTNQILKARGMSGKMALLVAVHWVLRDWRVAVMEFQAERMKEKLHLRWFSSLEQASHAWGRETDRGLKHWVFVGWTWQKKFSVWERRTNEKVQFTLRRWFYALDTALRYYAFLAWYEALMEAKLQSFQMQVAGKKSAFLKAILALQPSMTSLTSRAIFYAWRWMIGDTQVTAFSNALRQTRRRSNQLETAVIFLASETHSVMKLFVFKHWLSLMEGEKAKTIENQLKKTGASLQMLKALTHYAHDGSPNILLQSILLAWRRLCSDGKLEPELLVPNSRYTMASCISAWDFALTSVAILGWHNVARRSYFQKTWTKFFRPEDDLRPLVTAWKKQVQRSHEVEQKSVKVDKKETDISHFIALLCFVYWRLKLKPSRAVVSYVPKLARLQAVAVQKLAETQVESVCLLIFHAWRMSPLLAETSHEEGDEAPKAHATVRQMAESKKKELEDEKSKVAALEKDLKDLQDQNAAANAKVEKLEAEDGVLDNSPCADRSAPSAELRAAALGMLDHVARPRWTEALTSNVRRQLEEGQSHCGLTRFLAQLILLINDALNVEPSDETLTAVSLDDWIEQRVERPLPSFFRLASSFIPEVLQEVNLAIERWVRSRDIQVERYESCHDVPDLGNDAMAVNDDEKSSGITFWSKSLLLAHEIVRAGAFEWTNSARVAFSAGLIGPAKRAQCPSGVMAMKLIRCIGHDEEQKQEEVYSLDQEAQELLLWGQANLSKLLYNAWPLWSLLSLLSAQRHHSFVLTPAEPEPRLDEALLLQALDSGERPFGVVFVSNVGAELASDDLAAWLARLRRALLSKGTVEHQVLLVVPKSIKSCTKFAWFGASGPQLHCIWSQEGASRELDAQGLLLFILSRGVPAALLSTATLPFPGLGDEVAKLLVSPETQHYAMFITDTQVSVGAGESHAQRLRVHPPFADIGLRLFQASPACLTLVRSSVRVAYENPFLSAEEVLNRFNLTMEMDFMLNASHGFVSSEGWFAEDLVSRHQNQGNSTDAHLSGGILLFTMRPFNMMPKWFRGTACHSVCGWLLQCAPEALGSACALLGSDRLLLRTLQKSFALQSPLARSARPRILQAGPSGCGTTSIAHFYAKHGLRVAKNYVEGAEIRDHVRKDLKEGLAPFRSLDRFDAVVDAFDVVRVGVHFCSDHLGHGGMTCSHVHGDALDENLQEYRQILQSLHEAYPNLKFIHNSCNLQRWLPKRVHNCWPHLVSMGEDWQAFLELWNSCCAAAFGYGGNASCFRKQELQRLRIPQRLVIEDFAYPTCCEGLPFYQEAWHGVHQLLPDVIAPNRLVNFHIVHDDPKTLSAAMGLQGLQPYVLDLSEDGANLGGGAAVLSLLVMKRYQPAPGLLFALPENSIPAPLLAGGQSGTMDDLVGPSLVVELAAALLNPDNITQEPLVVADQRVQVLLVDFSVDILAHLWELGPLEELKEAVTFSVSELDLIPLPEDLVAAATGWTMGKNISERVSFYSAAEEEEMIPAATTPRRRKKPGTSSGVDKAVKQEEKPKRTAFGGTGDPRDKLPGSTSKKKTFDQSDTSGYELDRDPEEERFTGESLSSTISFRRLVAVLPRLGKVALSLVVGSSACSMTTFRMGDLLLSEMCNSSSSVDLGAFPGQRVPLHVEKQAASWHAMAPKMSILEYRTAKIEAQMNTVGFESGGMPKRMQGTKPNNMDSYKSRFETMGLAGGGSAAFAKSLQGNAEAVQQRAIALGEAMGAGGAPVPVVADAGRTMEKMLEKFVNSRLDKYAVAAAERQNKEFKKEEKKKHKKKDKKKDKKKKEKKKKKDKKKEKKKKKKKSSSSSSSSSSSASGEDAKNDEDGKEVSPKKAKNTHSEEAT